MICLKCGKEIANDSVFCEYCGTKTNEEQRINKVDIRWCLLPAMIIATIAMGFAAESWDIVRFKGVDHNVEPFFIIPMSLFVISCWLSIKKNVPLSFGIIIMIIFGINCKILYDSINTRDYYNYVVYISWSNDNDVYDGGYGYVQLCTNNNYQIENEEKAKKDLLSCAKAIEEKIKGEGKKIDYYVNEGSIRTEERHYSGWKGYEAFFYTLLLFLVYLIYSIFAYKKRWSF